MFYFGPTTGGQYITKATYNMEVPSPPTNWVKSDETQRWLSLWIGVQDNPSNGDVLNMNLVQPLLNWGPTTPSGMQCPEHTVIGQPYVKVNKEATLEFETKGMRPAVFYSGNECYGDGCGTLPAYRYTNITLVFNKAVDKLGDLVSYTNATHTEWQTKDNGITWTIDSITIAEDNLTE
ncbi:hypothetical protein Ct61P_13911 [Colletotrichum tofieldiae]|nr:hypothetical protein Ct61P_13911 [Colletotrichum tofieldiae]